MTPPTGVIPTRKIEIKDVPYPGIKVGGVGTIGYKVTPSNHTDEVEVTLDNDCLSVDSGTYVADGYTYIFLKAHHEGTAMVSIKAGNVVEKAKVDTIKGELTAIDLFDYPYLSVKLGEYVNASFRTVPYGNTNKLHFEYGTDGIANAVFDDLDNPLLAKITGLKLGETTVTLVGDNGVRSTDIKLSVLNEVLVKYMTPNIVGFLCAGESTRFEVDMEPFNAVNRTELLNGLVYESSNEEVAVIERYGKANEFGSELVIVHALKVGETDITVASKDGAITGNSRLTIVDVRPPVEEANPSSIEIITGLDGRSAAVGESVQVRLEAQPNEWGKKINYTLELSDDSVCKRIDTPQGVYLVCLKEGVCDITVTTSNGKTASTTINVVEEVKVDTTEEQPGIDTDYITVIGDREKYVKPGEKFNIAFGLKLTGESGDLHVEYSNEGIVDSDVSDHKLMRVTASKLGTTTLTIVASNGVRSEPITIHVVDKLLVAGVAVRLGVSDVYVGEEVKLNIRAFPMGAEDGYGLFDDIVVKSGDTDIAVIKEYGQGTNKIYTVKAITAGVTDIKVFCREKTINGLLKLVVSEGVRPAVEETAIDSIGISSSAGDTNANVGDVLEITLDPVTGPFPGMYVKYTLTSSDNSKCKVLSFADGEDYVQCLEAGNYTISVKTAAGKTASTTINVV